MLEEKSWSVFATDEEESIPLKIFVEAGPSSCVEMMVSAKVSWSLLVIEVRSSLTTIVCKGKGDEMVSLLGMSWSAAEEEANAVANVSIVVEEATLSGEEPGTATRVSIAVAVGSVVVIGPLVTIVLDTATEVSWMRSLELGRASASTSLRVDKAVVELESKTFEVAMSAFSGDKDASSRILEEEAEISSEAIVVNDMSTTLSIRKALVLLDSGANEDVIDTMRPSSSEAVVKVGSAVEMTSMGDETMLIDELTCNSAVDGSEVEVPWSLSTTDADRGMVVDGSSVCNEAEVVGAISLMVLSMVS